MLINWLLTVTAHQTEIETQEHIFFLNFRFAFSISNTYCRGEYIGEATPDHQKFSRVLIHSINPQ